MNGFDILILFLYMLGLWYVYQSILDELDKLTAINLNKDLLKEQLECYGLQDKLEFKFVFGKSPLTDTLNDFKIKVENKTHDQYFAIHWSQCSLSDFDGLSHRIIRLPPALNIDLFQAQAGTILAPRETIEEKLTVEDSLKLNDDKFFEINQPIFKSDLLKDARDDELEFEVNLRIQFSQFGSDEFLPVLYPVTCTFDIVKQPWQKAVYWRPKKDKKKEDAGKKDKTKKARKARKEAKYAHRKQKSEQA